MTSRSCDRFPRSGTRPRLSSSTMICRIPPTSSSGRMQSDDKVLGRNKKTLPITMNGQHVTVSPDRVKPAYIMMETDDRNWDLIFFLLATQNSTWVKSKKRCLKGSHVTLNSLSASWPSQNGTWVSSKMRCFKISNCILNLFSAFGLVENAI